MADKPQEAGAPQFGVGDVMALPWEQNPGQSVSPEDMRESLFSDEPTKDNSDEDEAASKDDEAGNESDDDSAEDESDEDESEDEEEDDDSTDSEDDDEDESDDEEDDDDVELYELPGRPGEKVTLDEALNGFLRQSDYTRKTQALAEERRTFEGERQESREAAEQYRERLVRLDKVLSEQMAEPDWDKLSKENPQQFIIEKARWDNIQRQREAIAGEHARVVEQQQRDYQSARNARITEERDKLHAAVEGWSDPEVAKKGKAELHEYALTQGFTPEQLDLVEDHRVFVMLRKAMLHDRAAQAKDKTKAELKTKVKSKKSLKAGTRAQEKGNKTRRSKASRKRAKAASDRLARSGDPRDFAAILAEMED